MHVHGRRPWHSCTRIGYVSGMLPVALIDEATALSTEFGGLRITFDEQVLRSRAWTVAQSRWGAELLRAAPTTTSLLELCTGAGHIGLLAVVLERPRTHRLVAVDRSRVACEFARRNAVLAGLEDRVEVREGLIDGVIDPDDRFELVIADPPWVARAHTSRFRDDPVLAIDSGDDGLDVAWSCLAAAEAHLVDGGSLLLQLGSLQQVDRVAEGLVARSSALTIHEIRTFDGHGVLVRIVREVA